MLLPIEEKGSCNWWTGQQFEAKAFLTLIDSICCLSESDDVQ